jgi:hypothetical protein
MAVRGLPGSINFAVEMANRERNGTNAYQFFSSGNMAQVLRRRCSNRRLVYSFVFGYKTYTIRSVALEQVHVCIYAVSTSSEFHPDENRILQNLVAADLEN